MATRGLLLELTGAHGARMQSRVTLTALGGVDAARRVRGHETTDVVILANDVMLALADEGLILANSLAPVAICGMAVAVRQGTSCPDIATEAAVRQALLDAARIAYSTGPSGNHLMSLLQGWGILPRLESRLTQARPGVPVAKLLADGEADLGFQQLSELIGQPGIIVLGPLPPTIQALTTFTAGIATTSRQPESARLLIEALTRPDTADVKRRYGMEPGASLISRP
jgi:molybdate transport system substrate-binding protein